MLVNFDFCYSLFLSERRFCPFDIAKINPEIRHVKKKHELLPRSIRQPTAETTKREKRGKNCRKHPPLTQLKPTPTLPKGGG